MPVCVGCTVLSYPSAPLDSRQIAGRCAVDPQQFAVCALRIVESARRFDGSRMCRAVTPACRLALTRLLCHQLARSCNAPPETPKLPLPDCHLVHTLPLSTQVLPPLVLPTTPWPAFMEAGPAGPPTFARSQSLRSPAAASWRSRISFRCSTSRWRWSWACCAVQLSEPWVAHAVSYCLRACMTDPIAAPYSSLNASFTNTPLSISEERGCMV